MKRFSICRITQALYPDVIGGQGIFCHELSNRQADLGHRVTVFTARRGDLPRKELVNQRYRIVRLDRVWTPWESMRMSNPLMPSLYSAIRRARADLVDAHSQLFLSTAISVKAAMDEGEPVVTTVHGLMAARDPITNLSQRLYLLTMGSWSLRNSTRVICLTMSDAKEVATLGVRRKKIEVIPVCVDPNDFRPERAKQEIILWVGRLVPEKRLDTLLAATVKLREKRRVRVMIMGDGPERRKLVRQTYALGISDVVQFKFRPNRSEVIELLRRSKVFVLPSAKEGLPLALLEAMASGNAVVASDLPSIREVLGDAGLFFRVGDSCKLASVLTETLSNPHLQRSLGRRAREIVEERYSWNTVLPKIRNLYAEIVAK